ncbi:MAG TPA: enoyl-CoA hydratase-related protein, partial [Acidimicrobiales bacterium]|nr:enoyl-CoA hydratase-related protein [Acidimicrobiales bacterium]
MAITHTIDDAGIAEVVMDNPPVNALDVSGWFELAETISTLGRNRRVRVVVLRAEGRGFSAGVDLKELQGASGYEALLGVNRG